MNAITNEMKIISDIEGELALMGEALDALHLTLENFEGEAYQPPEKFNELRAICFGKRASMFLCSLRLVQRDLEARRDEMSASIAAAIENRRAG